MTQANKNQSIDLIITNATIITMNESRETIERGSVAIDQGRILEVVKSSSFEGNYNARQVIDAAGKVMMPGIINTHTHIFQTFLRGIGQDLPAIEWLHRAIDPSVIHLGVTEAYYSALIGCLEAIKSGTTTLVEYNYANPVPNIGDHVISAYKDTGLRGIYARGILDTGDLHADVIQPLESEIADCERLIEKYSEDDMISIWIAPYTIMSASDKAFLAARQLADKHRTRITVHAATPSTIDGAIALYGMGDLAWEESIGFLGPDVLAVHCCAQLSDKEFEILQKFDVKISHNPVSNCYLGEGIAQVKEMLHHGLCVGLATDGPGSNNNQDMIAAMKFAALCQKVKHSDPSVISAMQILEMATIGGARAIGQEEHLGSIENGKKADLILINLDLINTSFVTDPVGAIVYSATQENVDTVVINGKLVMQNRVILSIDENTAKHAAKEVAKTFYQQCGF